MSQKATLYIANDSFFLLPRHEGPQRAAERIADAWRELTRPEPGKSGHHYNLNRLGGLGLAFAAANPDVPLTKRSREITDQVIGATCNPDDEVTIYHVMTVCPSTGMRLDEPRIETSLIIHEAGLPGSYVSKSLREFIDAEIPEDSLERPKLYAVRTWPGEVEIYHGDNLDLVHEKLWGPAVNDHIIAQIEKAQRDYARRNEDTPKNGL